MPPDHDNPPYCGLLVLDFSTLLPGPLATLMLAEMGAEVIKIENPDGGDAMRGYLPKVGNSSANFAMLNRGKKSLALDLKSPEALAALRPYLQRADVIVEQFRPGVMQRLGLDYDSIRRIKPDIIYCSITGYGQTGALASKAGHDLNYMAETGILDLSGDAAGNPVLPPMLAADIAGGAYPAVMNIQAAIRVRDQTGKGAHLDVAMAENLFPFAYWALGQGATNGQYPARNAALVTGSTPRYAIYRTKDGQHVAVAALEEKFWRNLSDALNLPPEIRADHIDPARTKAHLQALFLSLDSADIRHRLCNGDTCCSIVETLADATARRHFQGRGIFKNRVAVKDADDLPALPLPLHPAFMRPERSCPAPELGQSGETPEENQGSTDTLNRV